MILSTPATVGISGYSGNQESAYTKSVYAEPRVLNCSSIHLGGWALAKTHPRLVYETGQAQSGWSTSPIFWGLSCFVWLKKPGTIRSRLPPKHGRGRLHRPQFPVSDLIFFRPVIRFAEKLPRAFGPGSRLNPRQFWSPRPRRHAG